MKLQIHYTAEYKYREPVSLSPHSVRIFPRQDLQLKLTDLEFTPPENADSQFRRDLFDNDIAVLFFPRHEERFVLEMRVELETPERNPFHFLLERRAVEFPVDFSASELLLLHGFLQPDASLQLPSDLLSMPGMPTVESVVGWAQWCHSNIAYERRDEGDPFLPSETLERNAGSCRDYAVLFLEILRRNGLPARLVSGFLWEGDVALKDRVAQGAMHAWVETWLPGAGWIGIDPTNGVLCDHHLIPTAVGIFHHQISPVDGTYFADHLVEGKLDTSVSVERIGAPS